MSKLAGLKSMKGNTALIALFWSRRAYETNFNSDNFRELFKKEKNGVDNEEWTVLMRVCRSNP